MVPDDHKRPARLRRKPQHKTGGTRPKVRYVQTRLIDEPEFYCGNCRARYVSYDYPSERTCPYCGHSEV